MNNNNDLLFIRWWWWLLLMKSKTSSHLRLIPLFTNSRCLISAALCWTEKARKREINHSALCSYRKLINTKVVWRSKVTVSTMKSWLYSTDHISWKVLFCFYHSSLQVITVVCFMLRKVIIAFNVVEIWKKKKSEHVKSEIVNNGGTVSLFSYSNNPGGKH